MATRKKAGQEKETGAGEMLQDAAKAIGSTIGTIAKKIGLAEAPPKKKSGKLVKKDKKRLPRKEKKKAQKALQAKTPKA